MRNAAPSFDDAFNDGPARKAAPRKRASTSGNGASRKGRRAWAFREKLHKVARYGAIGMSAMLALAIMSNALVLQTGRHPAPLFAKSFAPGSNTVALGAPTAPVRKPTPIAGTVRNAAADPRDKATDPSAGASTHDTSTPADPIGRLLRDDAIGGHDATNDANRVLGAQRALVKLGFVLKPNGTLGPRTKKAIERFEKDRHLPIDDELTARLVRILAAESGIRID